MLSIIKIIISVFVVALGSSRSPIVFSLINALVANAENIFYFLNGDIPFLAVLILCVVAYICSFIAFKIMNFVDPDSKIMYVFGWMVIYHIGAFFGYVIMMAL